MDVPAAPRPPFGVARMVRGSVLATAGAALAVGGHVAGGGTAAGSPGVLLLVLLAAAACTLLSDREWGYGRLLVALLGVQLFVHVLLWLTCTPPTRAPARSGWLMLLAHVASALLVAAVLRHFERLYWRCLDLVRGLVRLPSVPLLLILRRPPHPRTPARTPSRSMLGGTACSRRGPPVPAV